MTSYQAVFGGTTIEPSDLSYRAITVDADNYVLSWPTETSLQLSLVASIMDVTAPDPDLFLQMPDATAVSTGTAVLFNNVGAEEFAVRNAAGVEIVSIAPGELWQAYLRNNATEAGVWAAYQFGAATSTADAASLAGGGLAAIGSLLWQSAPMTNLMVDYTTGPEDRAATLNWVATGAGELTLPDPSTLGNDWFVGVRNSGGGDFIVTPAAGNINALIELAFQPGDSAFILTDGTDFYTLGLGQSAIFSSDYTVIDLAGTGTYVLSSSELNRIIYKFTGILTGNRIVEVPETVQQYWVDNGTTGAFTLQIIMTGGGGVTIAQGERAILYCDGANVVDADTASVSLPIAIAQGGTGATTSSAARTNLGATATGNALFTAADAAAGRTALGATVTGAAVFTAADAAAGRTALGATSVGSAVFVAVDAPAARTALGATSVGSAVFTAADAAAGRTALGATVTGAAVFTAADAPAARTALGATSVGGAVFTAADAAAGQTALGATSVGSNVFTAADAPAARTALGATTIGNAVFTAADSAAAYTALGAPPTISGGEF